MHILLTVLVLFMHMQSAAVPREGVDVDELLVAFERLAGQNLWPGFEPMKIPLALYTGRETLLYHHPKPPEGFARSERRDGIWNYPGRHAAIVANSSADIGDAHLGVNGSVNVA